MLKEHTIELADGTKEYVVELTDAPRKECALAYFIESLNFVRETEKFKTAQLHRYLKCAYGTVCKVLDALCSLSVVEKISGSPVPIYKTILKKSVEF